MGDREEWWDVEEKESITRVDTKKGTRKGRAGVGFIKRRVINRNRQRRCRQGDLSRFVVAFFSISLDRPSPTLRDLSVHTKAVIRDAQCQSCQKRQRERAAR